MKLNKQIFYFLLFTVACFGQEKTDKKIDSTSFQGLITLLNSDLEKNVRHKYARLFLQKAKKENEFLYTVGGYEVLANTTNDTKESLIYLDSVVHLTIDQPDYFYPANAFLSKAIIYYKHLDYVKASENYLKARKYAEKYLNEDFLHRSDHGIGLIKNRLGDYESAMDLHQRNVDFFVKDTTKYIDTYLNSLFSLSVSKLNLKQNESVLNITKEGAKKAIRYGKQKKHNLFRLGNGVSNYNLNNYDTAIDSITRSIPLFEEYSDNQNLIISNYYLGLCYMSKHQNDKAVYHFNKIDSLVTIDGLIDIQARDAYYYLNNYYEKQGEFKRQLTYLKKLISIDSILDRNSILIGNKIAQQYDLPKLTKEKEVLISKLSNQNQKNKILLYIMLFVVILGLTYYLYKQKKQKKRFQALINKTEVNLPKKVKQKTEFELDVPEDIVNLILTKLQKFEKNSEFTDELITLSSLAKQLNTNSNYLSKIINFYKQKNFTSYLNDLRIEYAINEFQKNPDYSKYTISAIAKMMGFKSAETFSKTFRSKTEIYPSYFIKQLKKHK